MDRDVFVQNVKSWCEKRGIAPTVACKESGAGCDLLVNLQRGSFPSVAKVQLLAQYLGVTTSDLLGEEAQSSPPAKDELQRLSPAERELLQAYRKADTRAREIVHLTLQPFGLPSSSDEEKAV